MRQKALLGAELMGVTPLTSEIYRLGPKQWVKGADFPTNYPTKVADPGKTIRDIVADRITDPDELATFQTKFATYTDLVYDGAKTEANAAEYTRGVEDGKKAVENDDATDTKGMNEDKPSKLLWFFIGATPVSLGVGLLTWFLMYRKNEHLRQANQQLKQQVAQNASGQ